MALKKSAKLWMLALLFAAFLVTRLFVSLPYTRLASDNLKFMEAARNFPHHTLYNNQIYLLHPPLYPYIIHFFSQMAMQDYIAAILISLLSSIASFFLIRKFTELVTKRFEITFTALLLFTLSVDFIIVSSRPQRESLVLLLVLSSVYFYARGIKLLDKKSLFFASLLGSATALTTDHAIFLFPAFALTYIFMSPYRIDARKLRFPNLRYALVPVMIMVLVYGSWLGVRAYTYSSSGYYPAGLEGTPLKTKNFPLPALITPLYFDDYEENVGVRASPTSRAKNMAYNLGYIFNTEPLRIPRGLNFTTMGYLLQPKHVIFMLLFYLPLAMLALCGVYFIIRKSAAAGKIQGNYSLYMLLMFLLFLSPVIQRVTSPRYIYPAYIFFYYIIGCAVSGIAEKARPLRKHKKAAISAVILLLIMVVPYWVYNNRNFVFFTDGIIALESASSFITKNIGEDAGIMAQPGYGVRISYLTGNRVIGMPPKPQDMAIAIIQYNISYVVFGKYFTWESYRYSTDSVDFIIKNPDKFQRIAAIKEDYSQIFKEPDEVKLDEVHIYKVIK